MTRRENLIAYIRGEAFDHIPIYGELFTDPRFQMQIYRSKGIELCGRQPSVHSLGVGNNRTDLIRYSELLGRDDVSLFMPNLPSRETGHGSGEVAVSYDTGFTWRVVYEPTYFREVVSWAPDIDVKDLDSWIPEKPYVPERDLIKRLVTELHEAGWFVEMHSFGFWLAIYAVFMRFQDALAALLLDEGFMLELVERVGELILANAEAYLEMGVDGINWADDMGTTGNLLFSPDTYETFFYPWHCRLASLCRRYGAVSHMHSHGHIDKIMDMIVEAGIDVINPVGPGDGNDLEPYKKRWGDWICLNGGISKNIGAMTKAEMRRHLEEVLSVGLDGGRFMPRVESGIPYMSVEMFDYYMSSLHELTAKYQHLAR